MPRTIQDTRVARGTNDVRDFVAWWLNNNSFKVLDWQAQGTEIAHGGLGQKIKLHPRQGSIVALYWGGMTGGAVVFELLLVPEGPGTTLHGEYYVPGVSVLAGKEMDVCENPDAMGSIPRKKGYGQMMSFLQALGGFGGTPPRIATAPQAQGATPQMADQMAMQPSYGGGTAQAQPPQPPQQPLQPRPSQQPQQYQQPQQPQTAPLAPQYQQPQGQATPQGGQLQVIYCASCGMSLPPESRFCMRCGTPVQVPS
jgi:hypothetical protein